MNNKFLFTFFLSLLLFVIQLFSCLFLSLRSPGSLVHSSQGTREKLSSSTNLIDFVKRRWFACKMLTKAWHGPMWQELAPPHPNHICSQLETTPLLRSERVPLPHTWPWWEMVPNIKMVTPPSYYSKSWPCNKSNELYKYFLPPRASPSSHLSPWMLPTSQIMTLALYLPRPALPCYACISLSLDSQVHLVSSYFIWKCGSQCWLSSCVNCREQSRVNSGCCSLLQVTTWQPVSLRNLSLWSSAWFIPTCSLNIPGITSTGCIISLQGFYPTYKELCCSWSSG